MAWQSLTSTLQVRECDNRPPVERSTRSFAKSRARRCAGGLTPLSHRPTSSTFDSELRRPMAQQYIFQMQGLTKAYPGGKKVFENIWLSFYPDAKIGVVGVNGSGKSTLLKIMAGLDKEFSGEAKAADG
eukprot:gene31146-53403_t